MDGKWGSILYIYIEVDLWLILFFKFENSGGMGMCLNQRFLYTNEFRSLTWGVITNLVTVTNVGLQLGD